MSSELVVEGEYMSEKTMLEDWGWTQSLDASLVHAVAMGAFSQDF